MSVVLDSRVIRMTRWLLEQEVPRSTADLAADLGLSERVVRYRLGVVENYLRNEGAQLTRRRGSGLVVELSDELRARLLADLAENVGAPRVYSPEEREHLLIAGLLWAAPEVIPLESLTLDLEVSKTSARRDLQRSEPWLENNNVPLSRRPGRGIALVATERQVRRAMVQLFLEAVPADVHEELSSSDMADAHKVNVRVPGGFRERLAALPLRECSETIQARSVEFGRLVGNSSLLLTLYLAISSNRILSGRFVSIDTGYQVSLMDHPASSAARALMSDLADLGMGDVPVSEIASLTEFLLGLNALAAVQVEPADIGGVLDEVLDLASERIHPSLAEDPDLRHGLALHLGRLSVRLKYGLPIHNPLLSEVMERYADVHEVAGEVGALLGTHFAEGRINEDEVGFITMYLSGAMERARLRPRRRALIVCPSGMATAWVLVSRVQAEFPELSITEVLSARAYDGFESSEGVEFDLVISTVPLEEQTVPVVVVNPLLPQSDVAKLGKLL